MIPKVIHYVWVGPNKIGSLQERCISSWKRFLPSYELKLWNEQSLPKEVFEHPYVKKMYEQKKWAFVSDYIRFWVLEREGGIYLDTDTEVLKSFDDLLAAGAFFGKTKDSITAAGVIGAIPHHQAIKAMLAVYDNDKEPTIARTSPLTVTQVLDGGSYSDVVVYDFEYFNPCDAGEVCGSDKLTIAYANNHWAESWQLFPGLRKFARAIGVMPLLKKLKTLMKHLSDKDVSKWFLARYALGQCLAYTGIGKYISFRTPYYRLFLTKSPVAMVLYGDPHNEREEEKWLDKILRPGDVVIDAGANIGTFSLKAASLAGKDGQVFAVEAHPSTAHIIQRNIDLNKTSTIRIIQKALGDTEGEVSFSTGGYDDVNHIVDHKNGGLLVPSSRLDDIPEIKDIPKVRCLKIDVEGYELPLLQGAENTIAKTDYVLFEAYEPNCVRFGYTLSELFSWFISRGYKLQNPENGQEIDVNTAGKKTVTNIMVSVSGE